MSERPMSAGGPLKPDPDAMHDFLSWWFHDCTRGVVEIGSLQPGTTSLSVFQRFNLNEMEEAAEYAARVNAVAGASTYFRAATISPAATPGRTTDADALQAPGLWADHDSQASVDALATNPLPFKPTGWIITGTVPHMRVQSYWRLSEPLVAMDMVRGLNKRIIAVFGCDTTTFNPSRLMRLPGSIAWPVKAGRSIAELTTWQRGENRPSALPLHQVTFSLPEATSPPPPSGDTERPAGVFDFGNTPTRVSEMMAWARTPPQPGAGGHWHETVLKLVAHWVGRGLSSAEILAMAGQLTAPGYSTDQTRRELQTMIDGARRKWAVPDEDRALDGKDAPKASGNLPLIYFNEVQPSLDAADFVEGILVKVAMSVIYGPSNCGKTFFASDLALHVATGRAWRGRQVDAGAVIYCALEGSHGIANRVAAWRKHYGYEGVEVPFAVIPVTINLLDPDADRARLAATVAHAAERMGEPVKLIVIDTLSRAMAGGNENAPDDMGALVASADYIRQTCDAHIMFIHHSGKDEAKGARGHSLLRAATDTEIEITRQDSQSPSVARVTKQREMEIDGEFVFKLAPFELGANRRGKPVTSCIVEAVDGDTAKPAPRLPDDASRAIQILHDLCAVEELPGICGIPGAQNTSPSVAEGAWREAFYSRAKPGADPEAKRKAFRRASDLLVKLQKVGVNNGRVWPC
jgi:hypothetical protein